MGNVCAAVGCSIRQVTGSEIIFTNFQKQIEKNNKKRMVENMKKGGVLCISQCME